MTKINRNIGGYNNYIAELMNYTEGNEQNEKAQNQQNFNKNSLIDTYNDLYDNSYNDEIEMLKQMSSSGNSNAKKISASFDPALELTKLASARTSSQVRRYMASINSKIAVLKKSGNYDTLVKRFKKILAKADEKLTNVQREESVEKRIKALEREKRLRESREVKKRLTNKRTNRMLKESSDVMNAQAITFVADTGSSESSGADMSSSMSVSVADTGGMVDTGGSIDMSV